MQPGDTFHPNGVNNDDSMKHNEATEGEVSVEKSVATDTPAEGGWYHPDDGQPASGVGSPAPSESRGQSGGVDGVTWEAAEFVAQDKTTRWYVGLGLVAAVLGAVLFFLTRDIITVVAITLAIIAFGAMGARRPRTISYGLNNVGVGVGEKFYPYSDFKSYSISGEGPVGEISLVPTHRFKPLVSVYFTEEQSERIMDVLADHLPFEHRRDDPIDSLMRRLRF